MLQQDALWRCSLSCITLMHFRRAGSWEIFCKAIEEGCAAISLQLRSASYSCVVI